MRFTNSEKKDIITEIKNEVKEKSIKDQTGIKETRQPVRVKEYVTMTLVNMRKTNAKNGEILMVIKGGETLKGEDRDYGDFKKVTYKGKEGYINKKYLR